MADARLHRHVAAFVRAGLSVEVLGLGDPAGAPAGAARVTTHPRGSLARRGLDALLLPWRSRGRVLMVVDPDTLPAAYACSLLRRRPLVADVHEDYARLLRDRSWARGAVGLVARAVVSAANAVAGRADVTVVADEHVPPAAARDRRVVRNLPDGGYLPEPGPPEPAPRAVSVGDLRRSRGLFTMLDALADAPGWTLDLVGPVAPADAAALDAWLADSPAADRVRLHGRLPPRAAWALAAGAWAGLAVLDDTPAFRDAVPTKLYEFLGAGLAFAVTPLPRMVELAGESGAGVVVADSAGLAAALRGWAEDPGSLERSRASAREWAAANLYGPSAYDDLAAAVARLARKDAT
ncbi:glycosyltransferase involved in cell wall biosynthesis [Motilibacter peucedani]|uniref:Glycosyltransferase involved in cell wall biosynthesis n=1 Tax=Motilibacter peucedani TaxID=598650 RepID=A0A420XLW5_9ACTN|nr:glycosyltransferase involved in cell wall biosynthesis [Motilibacter peucedani]